MGSEESAEAYAEDDVFINELESISAESFSPISTVRHYLNMAKRNDRIYLQQEKKKANHLLNIVRPILYAQWVLNHQTFPS
ncbi:nucleotidyltransferase domain-containing protein [Metabacillus idriensis]|nr:nucleotidyltransferase domain-containing protein [Metabacillus idriensis]MDR0136925.1 nucleotidyltransferase domain-containing protein [Metabacillus idriensis]